MRATMKYICKKFINHQIKKCLLFRCRHAVVIMQTLNWTNHSVRLFMTVRHIFEISEDDPVNSTIYWNDNCGSKIEAKMAEIEARFVGMIQAPTRKFTKFRLKIVHHFM